MQRINISIIQTATERKSDSKIRLLLGLGFFCGLFFFLVKKEETKKNSPPPGKRSTIRSYKKQATITQWEIHHAKQLSKHTSTLWQSSLSFYSTSFSTDNCISRYPCLNTKKGTVIKLKGKQEQLWHLGCTRYGMINFTLTKPLHSSFLSFSTTGSPITHLAILMV